MHDSNTARKSQRRAFIPMPRDLQSRDAYANPLHKHPGAVEVLMKLVAWASVWGPERATVQASRTQLAAAMGLTVWRVRRCLAALEALGFIACIQRGRGELLSTYAITDFDSFCKLGAGSPERRPSAARATSEYGYGIQPNDRWCRPSAARAPDFVPHMGEEEQKNSLPPPPEDACAREARTPAAGTPGGGGTLRGQFSPPRAQEDWEGLKALEEAQHAAAEEPSAAPATPPAPAVPVAVPLAPEVAQLLPEHSPVLRTGERKPDKPTVTALVPANESALGKVGGGAFGVKALAQLWNAFAGPGVPKVLPEALERSEGRAGPIAATLRDVPDPAFWYGLFLTVAASPFLQGRIGDRGFRATLGWVVHGKDRDGQLNRTKIVAGQYADQQAIKDAKFQEYREAEKAQKDAWAAEYEEERKIARIAAKGEADARKRSEEERTSKGRITLSRAFVFGRHEVRDS